MYLVCPQPYEGQGKSPLHRDWDNTETKVMNFTAPDETPHTEHQSRQGIAFPLPSL